MNRADWNVGERHALFDHACGARERCDGRSVGEKGWEPGKELDIREESSRNERDHHFLAVRLAIRGLTWYYISGVHGSHIAVCKAWISPDFRGKTLHCRGLSTGRNHAPRYFKTVFAEQGRQLPNTLRKAEQR